LKQNSWKLEPALEAFYNDPTALRYAEQYNKSSGSSAATMNSKLEKLWDTYKGNSMPLS
jgi:hypothetical protein